VTCQAEPETAHYPEEFCGALLDAAQHPEEPSTMDSLKALSGTLFRLVIGMNCSHIIERSIELESAPPRAQVSVA